MARRRWIYVDGVAHEVDLDYVNRVVPNHDALLFNDRLYQDDGDPRYTSRTTHREYMKRNNLSLASDYTNEWANAAKARANIQQGVDPRRREDIVRAVQQLRERRR